MKCKHCGVPIKVIGSDSLFVGHYIHENGDLWCRTSTYATPEDDE